MSAVPKIPLRAEPSWRAGERGRAVLVALAVAAVLAIITGPFDDAAA